MSLERTSRRRAPVEMGWIDTLPEDWDVLPFWAVCRENNRSNAGLKETNLLSLSYGNVIRKDINSNNGLLPESFETYQIVEPDDIVFRLTDLQNDKKSLRTALVRERGIMTSAYLTVRLVNADARFLAYLMRDIDARKVLYSMGGGLRQSMKYADLKRLPIQVPPRPEQEAIAEFLDRETAEIDAFIRDQEELIGLLQERRAATISHAVTKGLNPDASMRESGLIWFGQLPAHWSVSPLARTANFLEGPGIGLVDFQNEGIPLLRIAGVRTRYATLRGCNYLDPTLVASKWSHFRVRLGDLLVSASASMGTVSEAGIEVVGAVPYTGIIRFTPGPELEKDFLRLFLESSAFLTQVDRLKTGSTMQHYGPEHLRQMKIALPPLGEQQQIATQLALQLQELDSALEDAVRAVALSRERRSALISAAVTGKIDVREQVGV